MVPTTIYSERIDTLPTELSDLVRAKIGAIASLSGVDIVPRLPKTRSRKILRRALRQIVDGQTSDTPSTIENPTVAGIVKVLRPNTAPGEPMQPHHRLPDPVPVATKTTSAPGNRFAAAELAPPSAGSLHPVVGRYPQPPNRIDNDAAPFGVHRPETPRTAVFRIIAGTYAPLRSFEHWPAMNSSEAADH
ncbi:propionyl-CoA synthetase [Rhodococcus sp. IEGM 248]|nr:propionyl-CoA synthetase [Rhodococcus sp. IEGM 248]